MKINTHKNIEYADLQPLIQIRQIQPEIYELSYNEFIKEKNVENDIIRVYNSYTTIYKGSDFDTIKGILINLRYTTYKELSVINKEILENGNQDYLDYMNFKSQCKTLVDDYFDQRKD